MGLPLIDELILPVTRRKNPDFPLIPVMSSLVLSLDQFLHQPLVERVCFSPADLKLEDPQVSFSQDLVGEVTFTRMGEDVMATGFLKTRAETFCVRCLGLVSVELDINVSEVWLGKEELMVDMDRSQGPGSLHRVLEGDTLELKDVYRELVMSELPDRSYCNEDCWGLCPRCGQDLNLAQCRCDPTRKRNEDTLDLPVWKKALKNIDVGS